LKPSAGSKIALDAISRSFEMNCGGHMMIRGGLGRCRMGSKVLEMLVEGRKEQQRPRSFSSLHVFSFYPTTTA
jgi:hypothetical protein